MSYRSVVDADGVYIHYDLNGDYDDQEGVATTSGTQYGGSSMPSFVSSILPGQTSNSAVYFIDTNGGVYVGTAAQAQACFASALDDNGDMSIECWYKSNSSIGGMRSSGVENLIRHDGTLWWLRINNKAASMLINTTSSTNFSFDGSTTLSDDTLYHIVGTYTGGSDKKIRIYINGVLDGTSTAASGTLSLGANGNATYLGSPGSETARGTIDEVALYRKALSSTEVLSHYNEGIGAVSVSINAGTISNIAIAGKPATISAGSDTSISAPVSNIAIAGQPSTITASSNVQVENSPNTISITSFAPDIAVQGSVIISVNAPSNIAVDAKDVTVTLSSIITVPKTGITIAFGQVNPLYPTFVLQKNPIHYYRFNQEVDDTQILDYGTSPVNANARAYTHVPGIPGDPESESIEFNSSASDIVTFPSTIFDSNTDNATYEFWIKTTYLNVPILVTDEENYTLSGILYGGQITEQWRAIGILDGYFGLWSRRSSTNSTTYPNIFTDSYIADGNWHHIVLTKSTSGSITTYASYVDTEPTSQVISLAQFLPWSDGISAFNGTSTSVSNSFMAINDDNGILNIYDYSAQLDEVAIYDLVLTTQEINDHYISGFSQVDVEIEVDISESNIFIGSEDVSLDSEIEVNVANINITGKNIIFSVGGNTVIGTNSSDILITGQSITLSSAGSLTVQAQVSNTNIIGRKNKFGNKSNQFKFIASTDISPSARDASTLTELDYGGLLYNQIKKLIFRIGNTSDNTSDFIINSYANETQVTSAVQFSYDNITYTDSITIEGILPNDITEVIYVKFDVNNLDVLGVGTFLISVEQQ